jgi:hypothetical protein
MRQPLTGIRLTPGFFQIDASYRNIRRRYADKKMLGVKATVLNARLVHAPYPAGRPAQGPALGPKIRVWR